MYLKGIVPWECWQQIYTSWGTCLRRRRERGTRSCEKQPKNVKKPYGGEIVCPDWSKIMGKRKK
ncbi:MAG: hypothetical protein B6D35_04535 [Candidatus Brocadia sp. UTAMX2]|nr:MAG: hypothetical protein B6D35_04535 [Candidatus Brocadia sp. UTAMX2]